MKRHLTGILVASALLAGCVTVPTSGPLSNSNTRSQVDIEITNNMIPPGPAYIYLVTTSGMERDMGTAFGGTHVLTYKGLALSGSYQFVAKTGERTIASPVLVMNNITSLKWDLERNYIEVTGRIE